MTNIPVAYPKDGKSIGLVELMDRMSLARLKVSPHLAEWFNEFDRVLVVYPKETDQ
jgi:hypothetical protein